MKIKLNKKSVLWVWVVSYLLVLLLPLAFSFFVYWMSLSIARRSTEKLNAIAISQTEAGIDRIFMDISAMGRQILNMQQVTSLSYAERPLNIFKREKIGSFQAALQEYVSYSDYLTNIYVCFNQLGLTASTEGLFENSSFLASIADNLNVEQDTISAWINTGGYFQVRMAGAAKDSVQARKILIIMSYSASNRAPEATCIFVADSKAINGILSNKPDNLPGETLYLWAISPTEGLTVCPKESEKYARLLDIDFRMSQPEEYLAAFAGRDMAVTVTPSSITDWLLVSAIPMSEYTSELNMIRRTYIAFLSICVFVGIAASVKLAFRNYKPILRLFSIVEKPVPGDQSPSEIKREGINRRVEKSEFDYLEDSLSSLILEKQRYEKELGRQRSLLAHSNLIKMLLGTFYTDQAFVMACRDYSFNFSSNRYLVAGVIIRDYDMTRFAAEEPDGGSAEIVGYIVSSVLEELLRKYGDCYGCRHDEYVFCIMSQRDADVPAEIFLRDVKGLCAEGEELLGQQYKIETAFYVSGIYSGRNHGVTGIHEAYLETRRGIEQMEGFQLPNKVMSGTDLIRGADESETAGLLSMGARRRHLSNAITAGDIEAADEIFASMTGEGIARLDPSFSNVKLHGMFLLDYLVSNMDAMQQDQCGGELLNIMHSLREARNMDEFHQLMRNAFSSIHRAGQRAAEPGESVPLNLEISRYINDNYSDPNLSVASIAEHFGFSKSYLLRVFKKGENCGVLDYIHQRRIDMAKNLLLETSDTVNDIALKIGYANSLALIRAFKRLEYITPTAYRQRDAGSNTLRG